MDCFPQICTDVAVMVYKQYSVEQKISVLPQHHVLKEALFPETQTPTQRQVFLYDLWLASYGKQLARGSCPSRIIRRCQEKFNQVAKVIEINRYFEQ